jgi:hypothetical protein
MPHLSIATAEKPRLPRLAFRAAQKKQGAAGIGEDLQYLLRRERARADRTGQPFSQVVIDCAKLDSQAFYDTVQTICRRVRCTDEVRWFEDFKVAIVLPNTPSEGAWKLCEDLLHLFEPPANRFSISAYSYPLGD